MIRWQLLVPSINCKFLLYVVTSPGSGATSSLWIQGGEKPRLSPDGQDSDLMAAFYEPSDFEQFI